MNKREVSAIAEKIDLLLFFMNIVYRGAKLLQNVSTHSTRINNDFNDIKLSSETITRHLSVNKQGKHRQDKMRYQHLVLAL